MKTSEIVPSRMPWERLRLQSRTSDDSDAVRTTPFRIAAGLALMISSIFLFVREVDLAAHPGGRWLLAFAMFIMLLRILPH